MAAGRATAFAASGGQYEHSVRQSMALLNVFPGLTATSTPLAVTVKSAKIPENAVVVSVAVDSGPVTKGRRVTAANVIRSYNIQGPGMAEAVKKTWAGKMLHTTFSAGELGSDAIPVQGVWRLSMTGNNAGTASATTTHQVVRLIFTYRVP